MAATIRALVELARTFQRIVPLEEALQSVVDGVAVLLETPRASLRLFDDTRTRLVATCRAGRPHHLNPLTEFAPGQGLIGWIAQHGEPVRTGDAERDPRFEARPDQVEPLRSFLGVPLVAGAAVTGVLSVADPARDRFSVDDGDLLALIAALVAPHIEFARRARLEHLDPVTGALGARALDLALPDLSLLAVALFDIDGLARVNAQHGRAAGDEVLRRVTRLVGSVQRAGDALVRIGDDEFLLVLPATEITGAAHLAEQVRARVAGSGLGVAGVTLRVTVTAGIAARGPEEPRAAVVDRARAVLARAKRLGGNRLER